jgi:hypothetical protein
MMPPLGAEAAMLDARIELRGDDLYCSDLSGEGGTSVKRLTSETLSLIQEWAGRYDAAVRRGSRGRLRGSTATSPRC